MGKVLLLVEGQTEERFVKDVLQPHLSALDVHPIPTLVVTKTVKSGPTFKGGITSFGQVERDLRRLLGDRSAALVTTMFDLYGLPDDFPGTADTERRGVAKAEFMERALEDSFGRPRTLKAFITVHEFEGLLFCGPAELAAVLAEPEKASTVQKARQGFSTPEHINDGSDTHPASRIQRIFPTYRKRLHGAAAVGRIGLILCFCFF